MGGLVLRRVVRWAGDRGLQVELWVAEDDPGARRVYGWVRPSATNSRTAGAISRP